MTASSASQAGTRGSPQTSGRRWLGMPLPSLPLSAFGGILWLGSLTLTVLSGWFRYGTPAQERPILLFFAVMMVLFAAYFGAVRAAFNRPPKATDRSTLLLYGIAMRVVLLFSSPIQELDYYRYMWDGETVLAGVSPYRYSPHQVLAASTNEAGTPLDLQRLAERRDKYPRIHTTVSRVHYGELPSIYPPVSLAVFTLAAATTPAAASVETAIVVLKFWILAFDVGIILMLCHLLEHLRKPVNWAIPYAWCPLVLKEFANSGHLDAIAVLFMMGSLVLCVTTLFPGAHRTPERSKTAGQWRLPASAIMLGLGIGAKLFPIVLVPLMTLTIARKRGRIIGLQFLIVTLIVGGLTCWPMLGPSRHKISPAIEDSGNHVATQQAHTAEQSTSEAAPNADVPPLPEGDSDITPPIPEADSAAAALAASTAEISAQPPRKSLTVFLTRWRINDLIFMVCEANLTPDPTSNAQAWYTWTPATWRRSAVNKASTTIGWSIQQTPFLLARSILAALFGGLALWWSIKASGTSAAEDWLRFTFLTLAWFWALSPTLNPWYWTWALPLLAFSRHRAWFLVSALLTIYYLRFFLATQSWTVSILGARYSAESFFHFVVVWMEHLPWLLLLAGETLWASFPRDVRTLTEQHSRIGNNR